MEQYLAAAASLLRPYFPAPQWVDVDMWISFTCAA